MVDNQRRKLLRTLGITATVGLSGCSQLLSEDTENDPEVSTSPEQTPEPDQSTNIEFLQPKNIETVPIVTEENNDKKSEINLKIKDQNGLEQIQVAYNDQHRDQPHTLYNKTQDEFEEGIGNQMIPISTEFPQKIIAPQTGEFQVEVTDTNGNTKTRKQKIHNQKQTWKIDLPNNDTYTTERNWDNLHYNQQRLNNHASEWHNRAVYQTVLNELEEVNKEKYNGGRAGTTYSNSIDELGKVNSLGHWDPEFYEELTNLEHILGDGQNAILTHQRTVHPTAYSDWNNRFAATLEDIIHKFNAEAKQHLEETGEKAVNAGYVNEGGHGTVITYTNLEDTDIEAEHPWQFVDTTDSTVAPVTQNYVNTRGNYNPFVDGYKNNEALGEYKTEPSDQSNVLYQNEKDIAQASLVSFISSGEADELDWPKVSISDNILEDVFNDHVPSGGSIDPIIGMIERTVDLQMNTDNYIQVYGEDLENYQIAVTEDEELYDMSMDPETQVTEEEVENYLTDLPA